MASRLEFKKGNEFLISFSRISKINQAFGQYSETWAELKEEVLKKALQNIDDELDEIQIEIKDKKTIFSKLTSLVELKQITEEINVLKESRYYVVEARIQLEMLLNMVNESSKESKFFWRIA